MALRILNLQFDFLFIELLKNTNYNFTIEKT